jgi:aspartate racemase
MKKLIDAQNWPEIGKYLSELAIQLENAGADCIILCANTMHMVAGIVQQNIHVPLIHIAEATANEIWKQRIQKVGLLGTKFTMEQPFFTDILSQKSIQTFIPNEEERMFIHASIFDELGKNIFKATTKDIYLGIIENLRRQGAEGIIFGCTEIPMLIKAEECSIPVFDTTLIHAKAAVEFAQQKPI